MMDPLDGTYRLFSFKLDTIPFSFFSGGCLIEVHLYNKLGMLMVATEGLGM